MFCPNCGSQMPDNASFCPNCGYSKAKGGAFNNNVSFNNAGVYNNTASFNTSGVATYIKKISIVGAVGAILAFIGCFLPLLSVNIKSSFGVFSELDTALRNLRDLGFGSWNISLFNITDYMDKILDIADRSVVLVDELKIALYIIWAFKIIFMLECVGSFAFSLLGKKLPSRLCGLLNVLLLVALFIVCIVQFIPTGYYSYSVVQIIKDSNGMLQVGAGIIFMTIGSVAMLISA